jgi:hypothetical protein
MASTPTTPLPKPVTTTCRFNERLLRRSLGRAVFFTSSQALDLFAELVELLRQFLIAFLEVGEIFSEGHDFFWGGGLFLREFSECLLGGRGDAGISIGRERLHGCHCLLITKVPQATECRGLDATALVVDPLQEELSHLGCVVERGGEIAKAAKAVGKTVGRKTVGLLAEDGKQFGHKRGIMPTFDCPDR